MTRVETGNNHDLTLRLQRFMAARTSARKKMETPGSVDKLAELIKAKKKEADSPARAMSVVSNSGARPAARLESAPVAGAVHSVLKKAGELLLYTPESTSAPRPAGVRVLGNYVDMVA